MGGMQRQYRPDFIMRIDDGHDGPLNRVVETKGFRGEDEDGFNGNARSAYAIVRHSILKRQQATAAKA